MAEARTAGARFRAAVAEERPLQVVGAITAYAALMAKRVGFRALYLSGGGVAANSLGMPDLGISTMEDVLTDVRRITDACDLPLLVDVDTGWGGAFNIARTVRSMIKAGAGAIELHGVTLLKHADSSGMRWLIGSQLFLMASILGYCGLRLAQPDLAPLRAAITPDLKAQLDVLGLTVDEFLGKFYRLVYQAVALVTLLYQGGMALYYLRKRAAVAAALDLTEPA